ncbi:MAG TPA: hypothetical protein VMH20_12950 [Verrucomicrobiae bacterium]|jgi:hypothetical protein|nr:hypothetical protein [Verrucomicrobiae bacterium]
MCPFCWEGVGLAVAYIVSTGGLAALAVKVSATRRKNDEDTPKSGERSKDHGNEQDRDS